MLLIGLTIFLPPSNSQPGSTRVSGTAQSKNVPIQQAAPSALTTGPGLASASEPWTNLNLTTPNPPARHYHSMVYDAADNSVILFGGAINGATDQTNETWQFKAGSWTQLSPSIAPPGRDWPSMAYDEADGYVLLFGGNGAGCAVAFGTQACVDTWTFKAGTWTKLSPTVSPPARYVASMAYDAADGYVVLFGGAGASGFSMNDTWTFKAGAWTKLSPSTAPPASTNDMMAYDAADGYLLLSGECFPECITWTFKAGTWTQLFPAVTPQHRNSGYMAYDAADSYVLLFAGCDGGCHDDTWTFKAGTWTQLFPANHPPVEASGSIAYDAADGYIVLFGGSGYAKGITWEFKAGDWTTQLSKSVYPLQRQGASMAYDSADGYILLFGGYDGMPLNDTWTFKAGTWTRLSTSTSPSPRYDASMAYDAADGYVVLFGGYNGTGLGDTWKFASGIWTQLHPSILPSSRLAGSMTYDAADGYVLLFGGANGGSIFGDTWTFKAGAWTQLSPTTSPPARYFASMAYDTADGYVLLFGGYSGSGVGDTWTFKAGTWTQLSPSGSPSARYYSSMAYDAADGYILLFGGYDGNYEGDTWQYKANTWAQLTVSRSPSPRIVPAMSYDGLDGYVLLFGGEETYNIVGDTWKFSSSAVPADFSISAGFCCKSINTTTFEATLSLNTTIVSNTNMPSPRISSMVYDGADGYTVLFGGGVPAEGSTLGAISNLADTWKFSGGVWTNITSPGPSPRADSSIVYDAVDHYVLLFGGISPTGSVLGDTWKFSAGVWTNITSLGPSPRFLASMVFDQADGYVVLFGGTSSFLSTPLVFTLLGDTWKFSGGTWTLLSGIGPSARFSAVATYDAGDGYVLLLGGANATGYPVFSDTWRFSAGVWTNISSTGSPFNGATGDTMVYDVADSYVVLFGATVATYGQTWKYSGGVWTNITTTGPLDRAAYAMAYDPTDGYVVLFGGGARVLVSGAVANFAAGDTWKFAGGSWTRIGLPGIAEPLAVVSSLGGFAGSVSLAASVVPSGLSCTIEQPVLTLASTAPPQLSLLFCSGSPGVYNVTVTGSSSGTVHSASIKINVVPATHSTTTTVSCTPTKVPVHTASYCKATVTDTSTSGATAPSGIVTFTQTGIATGTLFQTNPCTLGTPTVASASCQVIFASANPGVASITASYTPSATDTTHSGSTSMVPATVTITPTFMQLQCFPSVIAVAQSQTCQVAVSATGAAPTGTVSFTVTGVTGTFTPSPCTLASLFTFTGYCQVSFSASTAGAATITANYNGDSNYPANSISVQITVANLHLTSISLVCSPTRATIHQLVTCTATVNDTSTIGATTPTGTISLPIYNTIGGSIVSCTLSGTGATGTCSGTGNLTGAFGPTPPSTLQGYTWYDGDISHDGSITTFSLSLVRTTTTTISCPANGTIGTAFTCTVTVTDTDVGTPITPTGIFTVNGVTCTLAGTAAASSCTISITPTGSGSLTVSANYPGDTTHATSTGTATVNISQPTAHPTTTTVSCTPANVAVGIATSCTATVTDTSNQPTSPSGTVTFSNGGSSGNFMPTACSLTVSGTNSATCTVPYTPTVVGSGSQSITGGYSGDSTHQTSISAVFTLTVVPAPDFALTPTSTTVTVGANLLASDKLRVDAINGFTGTVSFLRVGSVFGGVSYSCSSVTLSLTIVSANSTCTFSSNTPGTYTAIVNGTGGTPPTFHLITYTVIVVKNTPSIQTTLSSSTITVGGSVTDSATLAGTDLLTASGTVTYQFFSGPSCGGTATVVGTPVVVNSGAVPASVSQTFASAGPYSWNAVYSGDTANNGATSSCEPLTVNKASPTLLTLLSSNSITIGNAVSDSATLTGSFQASGTVMYTVFNNNICTGAGKIVSTVQVSGVVPNSRQVTFNSTGDFGFQASYSGDANNNAALSSCETLTVMPTTSNPVVLTFTVFDVDDFENGVGQLQVFVNGHLVSDIPAGLNHLTGSGDYAPYHNKWINFRFDITAFVVQGGNNITFTDPQTSHHFARIRDVLIVQGNTQLLKVERSRGVYPGVTVRYTFSNPRLTLKSLTGSNSAPVIGQGVTFTATYTGGTGPFKCLFRFGDGESVVVDGSNGKCTAIHDYDHSGNFTATVTIIGSATSDRVTGTTSIKVADDQSDSSMIHTCARNSAISTV